METTFKKLNFNKDTYTFKNASNIKESNKNKTFFKKYMKKKTFTFFNIPLRSFTKKSIGSRMGKGKGTVFNYYIQVYSGLNILFFINWEHKVLLYILKTLTKILPCRNKYVLNN